MNPPEADGNVITESLSDPHAFAPIFERHFSSIHNYLRRRLTRQLADELSSQTFLIAFDRRAAFDPRSESSRPWLFGIATNLAREHRRHEIRELRAMARLVPEPPTAIEGIESRVDAERMQGLLAQGLADLPAEEADVILLLVWAELNQAEIAAALSIPTGTVKSRLSRARERLRANLVSAQPQQPSGTNQRQAGGRTWMS